MLDLDLELDQGSFTLRGQLMLEQPCLLLDEPLAALDEGRKRQILPFPRRVRDALRLPMLYVSHAINEILYLTPYLAVMEQGRILGQGPFLEVIRQDSILGCGNTLTACRVLDNTLDRLFETVRGARNRSRNSLFIKDSGFGTAFVQLPGTPFRKPCESDRAPRPHRRHPRAMANLHPAEVLP